MGAFDFFNFPSPTPVSWPNSPSASGGWDNSVWATGPAGGSNGSSGGWIQDIGNTIGQAFNTVIQGAAQGVGQAVGQAAGQVINGVPSSLGITSVTQQTPTPTYSGAVFGNPTTWLILGVAAVAVVLIVKA